MDGKCAQCKSESECNMDKKVIKIYRDLAKGDVKAALKLVEMKKGFSCKKGDRL